MAHQVLAWEWLEQPGLDVAVLSRGADGAREVAGRVVTSWERALMDMRYSLRCDAGWLVQSAQLRVEQNGAVRELELRRNGDGWWVDGQRRPDLADARDIDIMGTPLTNTLPIQRLAWEPGMSRDFLMAYVRLPDLVVLPARQRYTALAGQDTQAGTLRRFRYEQPPPGTAQQAGPTLESGYHTLDSGFSAELEVDAEGLVIRYPPYWRRAGYPA